MTNTTSNYIAPTDERDIQDLAALARGMMTLMRCPGGRFTAKGYTCMHCGVVFTDRANLNFCGQPLKDDGYTPFDATVARRIMAESAEQYDEET